MIEIAGGIIVAILLLALLPAIVVGAYWAAATGLVVVGIIAVAWFLWAGAQSLEGLAAELVGGGVFLVWLSYEIKARREIAVERDGTDGQSIGHRNDR